MIHYCVISAIILVGLVIGASYVNQATREIEREVRATQLQIAKNNQELQILNASWEYLTNPSFVEQLASEHYQYIRLIPSTESSYSTLAEIPFIEGMEPDLTIGSIDVGIGN
ncbi:MAG: hypothetical protein OXC02_10920 [Rhodobacteraceae bacterium]|nr:hypothetical protein [Paracoccaceae bacterium]